MKIHFLFREHEVFNLQLKKFLNVFLLGVISPMALAQTYTTASNVVAWTANRPANTLLQDCYANSPNGACNVGTLVADPADRRNTQFVTTGSNWIFSGIQNSPQAGLTRIHLNNVSTNINLQNAITNNNYFQVDFQTAPQPAGVDLFLSEISSASPASLPANRENFRFAVFLSDDNFSTQTQIMGDTSAAPYHTPGTYNRYCLLSASCSGLNSTSPPSTALQLVPNRNYSLRFYIYGSPSGLATWDDLIIYMQRTTLADLEIESTPVTAVATATPGEYRYSYNLTVGNLGPDNSDALINDALPPGINLSTVNWTCAAVAPSTCATPNGSGALVNEGVHLPFGGTATFTIEWTGPAFTAPSTHNATIAPTNSAPTDPVASNNSTTITIAAVSPAAPVPLMNHWVAMLLLVAALTGLARIPLQATSSK